MDDDNISIGSDFSLGSSIDMLSNVKQNEEKNDWIVLSQGAEGVRTYHTKETKRNVF